MDLTGPQAQRHVVEGDHARELLADARHLQPHLERKGIRLGAHRRRERAFWSKSPGSTYVG